MPSVFSRSKINNSSTFVEIVASVIMAFWVLPLLISIFKIQQTSAIAVSWHVLTQYCAQIINHGNVHLHWIPENNNKVACQ